MLDAGRGEEEEDCSTGRWERVENSRVKQQSAKNREEQEKDMKTQRRDTGRRERERDKEKHLGQVIDGEGEKENHGSVEKQFAQTNQQASCLQSGLDEQRATRDGGESYTLHMSG